MSGRCSPSTHWSIFSRGSEEIQQTDFNCAPQQNKELKGNKLWQQNVASCYVHMCNYQLIKTVFKPKRLTDNVLQRDRSLGPLSAPSVTSLCVVCQEHPLSEEHHPLEPDHRLHPEERHLVHRAADHQQRSARQQRGETICRS